MHVVYLFNVFNNSLNKIKIDRTCSVNYYQHNSIETNKVLKGVWLRILSKKLVS